jgi:hypothetical protein
VGPTDKAPKPCFFVEAFIIFFAKYHVGHNQFTSIYNIFRKLYLYGKLHWTMSFKAAGSFLLVLDIFLMKKLILEDHFAMHIATQIFMRFTMAY